MKEKILQIGKASSWYLVAQGGYALMGLVSVPILTRVFSPSQYGVYSLVAVTIVLISPLFYITFITSTIRFYPEYEDRGELDTLYSTALHYVPHFMILVLGVVLPLAAFVLPLGSNRGVICLGIAIFSLFVPFYILLTFLQASQRARAYAILFLLVYVGRYLVGAALVKWGGTGVNGVFIAWLGALIVVVPIELILLRISRRVRWRRYSSELMKKFLSFGFVLVFANISSNILTSSDRYLVQAFKGSRQVGLYSVVYTLAVDAFTMVLSALQLGAAPVIMQTYERDGELATSELLSRITRYLLITLIPVTLGLYLLRFRVIHVLTSARYLPSATAVLPLALGIFCYNLAWIPGYTFYVKKKTRLILIPVVASATLNIGLNLFLIPAFGFVGAAWSTMVAYVVYLVIMTAMSERYMHWKFPALAVMKATAAGVVMGVAVYFLNKIPVGGFGGLVLIVVAGALIYILAVLAFRVVTPSEMQFTRETLKKLVEKAVPRNVEDE
ncbi:MAG TPA: polysaccharide biosynthesis C-terminal domain-containing protein [Candidatus Anoxymicrobiaceae bacterium]